MESYSRANIIKNSFIQNSGLRFDDLILLRPGLGRQTELRLNRTKFVFKTEKVSTVNIDSFGNAEFPQMTDLKFHFELTLIGSGPQTIENHGRFFLRVLSGPPVRLNGSFVYESFVNRSDLLCFGYNEICFKNFANDEDLIFPKSVIQSEIPLLIEGETGTGKTHLAKKIHENSNVLGPFVHINLSSFSHSLIESELFGHTKGAFTGAFCEKLGALRESNGGTLFLDEIDSLPYEIQTKLLLFLDSGKVRPVGSSREFITKARMIYASGRELSSLVESGEMRKDFFFRISSGFTKKLTPLRLDPEKIEKVCLEFSYLEGVEIPTKLIKFYKTYEWPGNIRQLIGHLLKKKKLSDSRFFSFDECDEQLKGIQFSLCVGSQLTGFPSLEKMKEAYCAKVYIESGGKVSDCAKILDITTNTVRSLLRKQKLVGK